MKHLYLPLILLFAAFGFIKVIFFPANVFATGTITITNPTGEEQFTVGDQVRITWDTDITQNCSIYYYDPNDINTAYAIGNVNDGTIGYIDWTVGLPNGVYTPLQEKVEIFCNGAPGAYSNAFTVNPNPLTPTPSPSPTNTPSPTPTLFPITITHPTTGDQFTAGDNVHITWNTDADQLCSIYYVDPNDPYTNYFIGNVYNGSIGNIDWIAALPPGLNVPTEEVIVIGCIGAPAAFSNVFTVNPYIPPTATPTSTPTATPTPTIDTTAPSVAITYPTNNSSIPRKQSITIQADAYDNFGVTKVEFYVDNALACSDAIAPYSCVWSVPAKPNTLYQIAAKAYDAASNTSIDAVSVTSH
jgi:hypothetical protein